jgi:hypothetical protein
MEFIPSWEAASHSAAQEFPNILLNPKVHYLSLLVPILSQMNPVHQLQLIYLRSILTLSFHLRLPRPCVTFRKRFFFRGEELSAPHQAPRLAFRDCLFIMFAHSPHLETVSSVHNPRTRHAVVTKAHLTWTCVCRHTHTQKVKQSQVIVPCSLPNKVS